mgnify:CR=1 FL=1
MNRLPSNSLLFLFLVSFVFLSGTSLCAQSFKDMFISKDDGAVDMSEFLNSNTGFLPVPIIVTEPAVGFGGCRAGLGARSCAGQPAKGCQYSGLSRYPEPHG